MFEDQFDLFVHPEGLGAKTTKPLLARARIIKEADKALRISRENPDIACEVKQKDTGTKEVDIAGAITRAALSAVILRDPLGNKL